MDDECRQSSSALDTSCWLASLKANGMEEPGLATLLFFIRMIIMTFPCYEKLLCVLIMKCIESSACVYHGFMTAKKWRVFPASIVHTLNDFHSFELVWFEIQRRTIHCIINCITWWNRQPIHSIDSAGDVVTKSFITTFSGRISNSSISCKENSHLTLLTFEIIKIKFAFDFL